MSSYNEEAIKTALGHRAEVKNDLPRYLKTAQRCLRSAYGKDDPDHLDDECCFYDLITSILHLARANAHDVHEILEMAQAQFDREETYGHIDVLLAIRAIAEDRQQISDLDTKEWGTAEWSFFLHAFGDELEPVELRQFDKWFSKKRFRGAIAENWKAKRATLEIVKRRSRHGAPLSLSRRS